MSVNRIPGSSWRWKGGVRARIMSRKCGGTIGMRTAEVVLALA